MPKQEKESKFAAKLRELGFEHLPQDLIEAVRKRVHSRATRRLIISGKLTPTFSHQYNNGLVTYVTDEFGTSWIKRAHVDLSKPPFGFIDLSAKVAAHWANDQTSH